MAKVLKVIATVAAVVASVALIASGVGSAFGIAALSTLTIGGASLATIATIASAVSAVASLGAGLLTKPPPAQGNVSQILIGANAPMPYPMGRTAIGGVLVHDVGYGPTVKDIPNPYRSQVLILSGVRIEAIEDTLGDLNSIGFSGGAASGYFGGFLNRSAQLGLSPEAGALAGPYGAIPDWSSAHKLSGKAAVMLTAKFDRDGKKFASGLPKWLHVVQGVWAYDPRLDSTVAGGSGPQRIDDEATWAYTVNPALHALSYAIGRRQNGVLVFGPGYRFIAVDVARIIPWANVCDANGWAVGGAIYEPGDAWANLKNICQAGGGEPVAGPVLTWRYRAPQVPLITIVPDDLADGDISVSAMQSRRERINTVIPEYRSEDHQWEYVQADAVTDAAYVTEDGEERPEVFHMDLVQDVDQAAQLAAYKLVDGRESGAIELNLKPRFGDFNPGQVVTIDIPEAGLADQDVMILDRAFDPSTGTVRLTVTSESPDKHDFALGVTGTAPPTFSIRTNAEIDEVADALSVPPGYLSSAIRLAQVTNVTNPDTSILTADSTGTVTIDSSMWDYPTPVPDATRDAGTIAGLGTGITYYIYFDDDMLAATSVAYAASLTFDEARSATTPHPFRHYLGAVTIPSSGSSGGSGGGFGGGGPIP